MELPRALRLFYGGGEDMPFTGSCHCGRNAFEVDGDIPAELTRCTCSFCAKRGQLYAYYTPDRVTITRADSDATYRWQTKLVAHHFCSACGCSVWTDSPAFERDGSWDGTTRRVSVNARLIDGFDAAEHPVTVIDGKNLW
ncbi:hypothetical protein [Sphingomonas sp.]|uniref:GFA family protein n=1 Tax=Sphingomonas sp. TaxID=28214 RepID=UPI001EC52C6F|nr:hypothetical protein [Sphingomonas sp.]MBX3595634.1 hypothetical protein [Sphingomonas sp.]